jgi:hypothetical protein
MSPGCLCRHGRFNAEAKRKEDGLIGSGSAASSERA